MPYHNTSNARTFNLAFNEFARTDGIMYAREFPMDVHTGEQYLSQNRASIGRQYVTQVLEGKVGPNCSLKGTSQYDDMTLQQRAVLSHMRNTTTDSEFDSALHAAIEFGALSHSAAHVFSNDYAAPHMLISGHTPGSLNASKVPEQTEGDLSSSRAQDFAKSLSISVSTLSSPSQDIPDIESIFLTSDKETVDIARKVQSPHKVHKVQSPPSSVPIPHNAAMADEQAPTPSRVTLSASSNTGRSVPLQQKAKRARKVK